MAPFTRLAALAIALWVVLSCRVASAHAPGVSRSEFAPSSSGVVRARVVLSAADARALFSYYGLAQEALFAPVSGPSIEILAGGVDVRQDGESCPVARAEAGPTEGDGELFAIDYACPPDGHRVVVDFGWASVFPPPHTHVARIAHGAGATERLLRPGETSFGFDRVPRAAAQSSTGASPTREPWPRVGSALALSLASVPVGFTHILTGFDHLLFVLALVVTERRLRSLAFTLSAFTLAHCTTLGLAVAGVVQVSPRWVEPAIAASIAVVAGGPLLWKSTPSAESRGRWALGFIFGLLHGLGFAGALAGISLRGVALWSMLGGFAVGLEGGQILFVSGAAPVVWYLRKRSWFVRWGGAAVLSAIASIGAVFCIARIVTQP